MDKGPEISDCSIVVCGNLNPSIFTPAWFEMHGLLPRGAADEAEVNVIHPQVTDFKFDWLRIQVNTTRFLAESVQAPEIRLLDLVARVFKEILSHTPLTVFGINRQVHFLAHSFQARDRLGRLLAPVEPWGDWAKNLGPDGKKGGMTSLTMTEIAIEGRSNGDLLNVTIEPSQRIGNGRLGVYIRVNDHYTAGRSTGYETADNLINALQENFEPSMKRANAIIDHIMRSAERMGS